MVKWTIKTQDKLMFVDRFTDAINMKIFYNSKTVQSLFMVFWTNNWESYKDMMENEDVSYLHTPTEED